MNADADGTRRRRRQHAQLHAAWPTRPGGGCAHS